MTAHSDNFFIKRNKEVLIRENDGLTRKQSVGAERFPKERPQYQSGRCRYGDKHPRNDRESND
jgi:hypothetical protein